MAWFQIAIFLIATAAYGRADIIAELQRRAKTLDRLQVDFVFTHVPCPIECDPFDQSKWELDGPQTAFMHYRAKIVRPNWNVHLIGPAKPSALPVAENDTAAWIDGVRTAKGFSKQTNQWSVIIDDNLYRAFGFIPVLSPLEQQVVGFQESLLTLLESAPFRIEEESDNQVVVAMTPAFVAPKPPWNFRIKLDKSRGYLPIEGRTWLELDGTKLSWDYRITASTKIDDCYAITEMTMASYNNTLNWPKWQIFHFKAASVRKDGQLTKQDLAVEIPKANVSILNELEPSYREFGEAGQLVSEKRWTQEERARQREFLKHADKARWQTPEIRQERQWLFAGVITAAAVCTIGLILWIRSRRSA